MTKNNSGALLEAALRYGGLGYRVFPCVPKKKNPMTTHGHLEATTDCDQIRAWWSRCPGANIGLATEGLLILDCESQSSWLADDPDKQMELACGPMALTARGGRHFYFRQPEGRAWRGTAGRIARYVDTRADGGYVVVPVSVLEGDRAYLWADGMALDEPPEDLPEPPTWLIAILDDLSRETFPSGDRVASENANVIPEGTRNTTLTSLAGSMRRVGMSQSEILAALLQANADRCVPPLTTSEVARIAESIARYPPDGVAVALTENHWAQMYQETATSVREHVDPGPIPDRLLSVPGFVQAVMDHTLATAPYPQPVLAFCGALTLQATLAGRKVRDEADNRTNLYVLGLANSGAGKDHPRKVNQKILLQVGMADCLGDAFASGEGIEDRLFQHPTMLFQTDEIDGLMMKINTGKDARFEGIMNVLLKFYSSANTFYPLRVKAGAESGIINQPCLSLFGTAIPKHYYQALSAKMLTNGFFARMLVLEADKRGKGQDVAVSELPRSLIETASWWEQFRPGGGGNLGAWNPIPQIVEPTSEARELFRTFRERSDDYYSVAEERDDPVGMAIWARANEKARKLALIYACSENHFRPTIGIGAAQWATEFVAHQTRRMLFMASGHVSETSFDAKCKELIATLRKWREKHGEDWMPYWKITRKHPWTERDHEEVRTALLDQVLIEYQEVATGGRPTRRYRLAPTF